MYDSLFSSPPTSLIRQLCCLLRTSESHVTVNMMVMQSQSGGADCGCFAIAAATALCHQQKPSSFKWAQNQMRDHLAKCFTNRQMTPFPSESENCTKDIKTTLRFAVFCTCRMPAARKGMVQCIECTEWFHRRCCNIPQSAFKKGAVWACPGCVHK